MILLLLAPAICFGEKSLCRKITRTYTRDHGKKYVTFKTPELMHLSAIKQCKMDTVLALHLHFYDRYEHFNPIGAIIEFEDGTIFKNEAAKVDCRQEMSEITSSSALGSHSGQYLIQGFFTINEETIDKFLSKKIVRIQLHDASQIIPEKEAIDIRSFLKCMMEKRS